jgi:protein required for attachment to host cells
MENNMTWLLIADASQARLYSLHKARIIQEQDPKNLKLIAEYTHEDSRKKVSDLVSDRKGIFGGGAFTETTSPKVHQADVFAHELLSHIEAGRVENSFRDLIIIAPPAFMGLLHKHMPHQIHKLVSQHIEKDYTRHQGKELLQDLMNHF